MSGTPQRTGRDGRAIALGVALVGIALLGIAHVHLGTWRRSPGGGAWLVPLLAYLTMLCAGAYVALAGLRRGSAPAKPEPAHLLAVAATALWGIGFFYAVRHVGLYVGTLAFLALAMIALSPQPRRSALPILGLCLLLAGGFYLMFTRVAPILVGRPLLF